MSDSDRQAGASGQLGPKSPDSKFRETSSISSPSERLHQGADSSGFAARRDAARRDAKSAYRAERTGSKLEKAKQRQAKQRPPKKPGPIKSARRTVQAEARRAVHGKIYQAEQENVGIEAAHRTELAGESALRGTSRLIRQRIRTRPARNVRKWEKRDIKAKADVQFRKLAQEHPELKKSALSRLVQKQRVKRQGAEAGPAAPPNTAHRRPKKRLPQPGGLRRPWYAFSLCGRWLCWRWALFCC